MIKVFKNDGSEVVVMICLDRQTNKYCFVNLTKKHVCTCRFETVDDALKDLARYKATGKIKKYLAV